jgi:choline-glycine betaine transporter
VVSVGDSLLFVKCTVASNSGLKTGLSIASDISDGLSVVGLGLMLIPTSCTLAAGATALSDYIIER